MNRVLGVSAVVCLLAAGCTSEHAALTVDQAVTLADQQVHLKVAGAPAGKPVDVAAEAVDRDGKKWHSQVTVTADDHGTVDLDTAKPASGSYHDVDGMGLFWSMNPPEGDPDEQSYVPPVENGRPVEHLEISVSRDGKQLASTTLTRQWMSSGVTVRPLTMAKDKLTGMYVAPKTDGAKHPAVLFFGGSEGGLPALSIPSLLASHGYPVLAVAYFHAEGVPTELRNVPIEYFATAARWLGQQPGVDPARVVVMSASFGTEAALLLADHFPALVHGAVLFAPGASATPSFPHPGASAWTYQGRPVGPGPIPVDGVDGPVLAVAGSADAAWDSQQAAELIMLELDDAHDKFPHEAVILPGAGHGVGGAPYLPRGTTINHPIVGPYKFGGTRPSNESAMRQGWAKTLALLASLQR
ncbi:dienelactone hydrolase [Kribbella sp. VKM Ac-2571]|uniref:acyl-CoA thioesterase/bile acid-CoA:amino acid N-acyltransferase family protein n=1 Tax=Kribbella sp. VKM Ac-2571 TaxID=2512222 RepID=UPI00105E9356|nr:acyl-CoA thioesterase/bile acid-CoA:amino acid N-acyltransferase family protein [Kribbella sp. VKM Ac-2571]TDO69384.1 dienelactone hydrolase [Kribbella sp. VKM Ac-2571]